MTIYICKSLISLSLKNSSNLSQNRLSLFFFSSSPKTPILMSDYLLHTHKFSPETASKVSSIVPFLKRPENTDSILSFLRKSGFSKTHLEVVIKYVPRVLTANLERTIKPKFKPFQDLGFSSTDIVKIVSSDPWILTNSVDKQIGRSILALKNVFESNADVCKVLKSSGWFLKNDLEKTMIPNVEFLKSCGVSLSQIKKQVYNFPRFFLNKPTKLENFVKRVDEMGFDRKSKMFIHAIRVISSMTVENWEVKLELFKSLGFSEDDISLVFRRVPIAFAVSERKIKAIAQLFLSMGKFDISFFVHYPEILVFSVENRLKPRLIVLDFLKRKNFLLKEPNLATVFKMTNTKFLEKYVIPYKDEDDDLFLEGVLTKGSFTPEVCA